VRNKIAPPLRKIYDQMPEPCCIDRLVWQVSAFPTRDALLGALQCGLGFTVTALRRADFPRDCAAQTSSLASV